MGLGDGATPQPNELLGQISGTRWNCEGEDGSGYQQQPRHCLPLAFGLLSPFAYTARFDKAVQAAFYLYEIQLLFLTLTANPSCR
jgi:hypothetical protein